jgi:hypothetical protein
MVAAQLTDEDLDDLHAAANSPHIKAVLRAYTTPVSTVQQLEVVGCKCRAGMQQAVGWQMLPVH